MAQPSLGYNSLAVSNSAVAPTYINNAQRVLIRCIGADVMIRDDGTNPTASVGFPLLDGEAIWFDGDLHRLKAIRKASTDATLYFLWY
jgi:hypothetical protein